MLEHSERILFVDDDAAVRKAFARSVRNASFELDMAESAEAALQMVELQTYAVIITDYRMPTIDGLELIEMLRDRQSDASFILISGECDLTLALQAVNNHNVMAVLCKPWNLEELSSTLQRGVELHWERVGQHVLQRNLVEANKQRDNHKENLEQVHHTGGALVADALLRALYARGHETEAHCRRVAAYSLVLAEQLGLKGRVLQVIEQGATLHDIGKIALPDALLVPDNQLSMEDRLFKANHVELGVSLLGNLESLKGARDIVWQHHERWDGTGYPRGLSGGAICIGARIFAVADTIDGILSSSSHQQSSSIEAVTAELLRGAGTLFDPEVVEAFCAIPASRWLFVQRQFADSDAPARQPAEPSVYAMA